MAFLPDCQNAEVSDFGGAWTALEPYSVSAGKALRSENMVYSPGQVGTRYGLVGVFNAGEPTHSLFNWLFLSNITPKSMLFFYDPAVGEKALDLSNIGAGASLVKAQTGAVGSSHASAGNHCYVAFYDANGIGASGGVVTDGFGDTDPLFSSPEVLPITATEPTSGLCTAGTHWLAYIVTSRSGFTGQPSPKPADSFTPISFTSSGGKNIQVQIAGVWSQSAATVQVLMTTVANPSRYFFVPGATFGVPGGSSFTATISVSISDDDLTSDGIDATDYFGLMVNPVSGGVATMPSVVFPHENRMVYVTRDSIGVPVAYVSDYLKFQAVSRSLNAVYLPGQLQITTGFSLRGGMYLLGPHWTYQTSSGSSGDSPASWPSPQLIDGAIGTISPTGVALGGLSLGASASFAAVADQSGLFVFQGGNYPTLPISYFQQDKWSRIDWTHPTKVVCTVDVNNRKISVQAPLLAAATVKIPSDAAGTYILSWDYTNGLTPDKVQFTLETFALALTGMVMVENPDTKRVERWLGSSGGWIARPANEYDATPYRDIDNSGNPSAIAWAYRFGVLPGFSGNLRGQLHSGHAMNLRVRGNGSLGAVVYNAHGTRYSATNAGNAFALTNAPEAEAILRFSMTTEQMCPEFSGNSIDCWMLLSYLKFYYTLSLMQR